MQALQDIHELALKPSRIPWFLLKSKAQAGCTYKHVSRVDAVTNLGRGESCHGLPLGISISGFWVWGSCPSVSGSVLLGSLTYSIENQVLLSYASRQVLQIREVPGTCLTTSALVAAS